MDAAERRKRCISHWDQQLRVSSRDAPPAYKQMNSDLNHGLTLSTAEVLCRTFGFSSYKCQYHHHAGIEDVSHY